MTKIKYIIVKNSSGQECAILFDKTITHREAARIHSAMHGPHVISAGFCDIVRSLADPNTHNVSVYGESESLGGLKPRPEDDKLIARLFSS